MGTPDLYTQVISAEWPLTSELEEIITDGITDGELPPACRAGSGDTTGAEGAPSVEVLRRVLEQATARG
jgi:hypothetical protein